MKRFLVALILIMVAGCGGGNGRSQAAATTTSTSSTTTNTTLPDPAFYGCRKLADTNEPSPEVLEILALSRDNRIVAAARDVEDAINNARMEAIEPAAKELVRACFAGGYLP